MLERELVPLDHRTEKNRTKPNSLLQVVQGIRRKAHATRFIHIQPNTIYVDSSLWIEEPLEFACPPALGTRIKPVLKMELKYTYFSAGKIFTRERSNPWPYEAFVYTSIRIMQKNVAGNSTIERSIVLVV